MAKKKTTIYLIPASDAWIAEQAKAQGISKNDVIQLLVNEAMKSDTA